MTTLTLGAGCFWCLDAVYQRTRGVTSVISGYTGGEVDHPTYEQVCSGTTGHAEALQVTFDESVVPADVILGLFFTGHDPTSLNRQGNDVGTQYRSSMFYRDEDERAYFQQALDQVQAQLDRPVVTTLEPLGAFWEAEPVHQDFYTQHPYNGYCHFIIEPKLAAARRHFHEWVG